MLAHLKTAAKHVKPSKMPTQKLRIGARYYDAKVTTTVGFDRWYKRDENNPWRPIVMDAFEEILVAPWLRNSAVIRKPPQSFHFNKLVRQKDLIKQKKLRKREWMMKAYMLAMKEVVDNIDDNLIDHIEQLQIDRKLRVQKTENLEVAIVAEEKPRQNDLNPNDDSLFTDSLDSTSLASEVSKRYNRGYGMAAINEADNVIPESWDNDDLFAEDEKAIPDLVKWR